jgi:transcriptional regulator with GAF, ATPase, and Fis domain
MNATRGEEQPAGSDPGEQDGHQAEDDDLRSSVASLASLATGSLRLEDTLTAVAHLAVRAIPGADGAGLTLIEQNHSDTVVTTAPFVREVDDIQYGIGQGPCISAARDGKTVRSGSLGGDRRWPQFGSRVARLGVHSAVSLPLLTASGVVGALNVYAHAKHAFDNRAAELGELFAVPAAIAVQNAQILAEAHRLSAQLHRALETRAVVDRAVGIVMSRSGGTEEQALARLRTLSQHEHQKLTQIAQKIVDEAVRRAESRRVRKP